MGDGRDSVDLADLFGLDGGRVHIGRPFGDAGQGRLYAREGHPGTAVKLFSPAFLFRSATDLRAKLTWMIGHPPADVAGRYRFAWPRELVVDRTGALAGYTMPGPADGAELRALFVRGRQQPAEARLPDWLVGPPARRLDRADRPRVAGDWRLLTRAAANLAAATAALHELGYVVGDFHDGLVRVGSTGTITLVDCDAMQVTVPGPQHPTGPLEATGPQDVAGPRNTTAARGVIGPRDVAAPWEASGPSGAQVYRAPVGRPEFTPSELLAERGRPLGPGADDYALAVHCFALLLGGHRPYTGTWRAGGDEPSPLGLARLGLHALAGGGRLDPPPGMPPADVLPIELLALFERGFGLGAGVRQPRPTAVEWRDALRGLAGDLRTCARTQTHHYRPGLDACPWCARDDQARSRAAALVPAALPTAPPSPSRTVVTPPRAVRPPAAIPARTAGSARAPGPRHRTPPRAEPRRWVGKLGAAVLCLLGAALMALTIFGAVDQPSATDQARQDTGGPAPGSAAAAIAASARPSSGRPAGATAPPGQAASGPTASQPAALWPWLGRWQSVASSPLPGFGLRIDDQGETGGQEEITATETSGTCPVRYHGTVHTRLDGPISTWPLDASVRLTLDAVLPAGQDPKGCALLPDPAFYAAGTGGELTSPGVIQFQVIGAIDDLAQARVIVHPGEPVALILQRV
ncbi:hypothetical protein [Pseudofrankia inefficax]|uniref:Protein kinase domain-containing protein n=1 Tax=Pseudofrankia inefficax (strain DSM 45817 / CECT 9037 / DDB 130130 / EuI1c) TaxID=298654 RepID=E3J2I1_PSEI1|nr:hypothetical protein [Pseudofrankia inefficax]ADP80495.1 hypothetical protein FraEuI1c_2461 [Pseudofrankia inefficax]